MTLARWLTLTAVGLHLGLATARADEKPAAKDDVLAASHKESAPLPVEFKELTALALDQSGRLLACDAKARRIKVIGPDGKVSTAIRLDFEPEAIDVADDGAIYCGGQGQIVHLDSSGKTLHKAAIPKQFDAPKTSVGRSRSRPQRVSGIAVSGKDVFVAYGSGWSLRSKSVLVRFGRDLEKPKLLVKDLRGCCQRCDIVSRDGRVYVAENTRHRVVTFDRDGKELGKFGQRDRKAVQGFGSCCNPMNLCFDSRGVLYTSESGLGRIKRYNTDGKFLGLVGHIAVERFDRAGHLAASCSNIAIAVTPDAERVYVMDYKRGLIRVLVENK